MTRRGERLYTEGQVVAEVLDRLHVNAERDGQRKGGRQCGSCTLCCRLLPISEGVRLEHGYTGLNELLGAEINARLPHFVKAAGERCKHQCSKGCRVYATKTMPVACKLFRCLWLQNVDTYGHRPDRAHYVIDPAPDHIAIGGERIPVIQVWIDPDYPDAWRSDGFRKFAQAADGHAFILRYNEIDARILLPPKYSPTGEWGLTEMRAANAKIGAV